MRILLSFVLLLASSFSALAEPVKYEVDQAASTLGFVYFFGDDPVNGRFPVFDAELLIDFESVSRSSIKVTLDATQADAGLVFAKDAMLGQSVLNVAQHPRITFSSTRIRLGPDPTVIVAGDLTIRDVTHPIEFTARLLVDDKAQFELKNRFFVELEGALSRRAFGADGFSDLVADRMLLRGQIAVFRAN